MTTLWLSLSPEARAARLASSALRRRHGRIGHAAVVFVGDGADVTAADRLQVQAFGRARRGDGRVA